MPPLTSIAADCHALMNAFIRTNDLSFQSFCEQWLAHEFYGIFYGLRTVYERIHFTEAVMEVVKEALLTSSTINKQIAALFLFYSLYHKQPLKHFIKMRLTLGDHQRVLQFHKLLSTRPQQHQQPLNVLQRLWTDDAFQFVAADREILRVMHRGEKTASQTIHGETTSGHNRPPSNTYESINLRMEMEDVFDEDEGVLARLQILQSAYNEMKETLGQGDANLKPSTICETVSGQLGKIADLLKISKSFPEIPAEQPQRELPRRERIIETISAIQRSKNTLPPPPSSTSSPGPSKRAREELPVVIEHTDDTLLIDTSFMSGPQVKARSLAKTVVDTVEEVKMEKRPKDAVKRLKQTAKKPKEMPVEQKEATKKQKEVKKKATKITRKGRKTK